MLRNKTLSQSTSIISSAQSLGWAELGYTPHDLSHLEAPFSTDELQAAAFGLTTEKAPGPDGFIGLFSELVGRFWRMICTMRSHTWRSMAAVRQGCSTQPPSSYYQIRLTQAHSRTTGLSI
jgi:hypothetical protein